MDGLQEDLNKVLQVSEVLSSENTLMLILLKKCKMF